MGEVIEVVGTVSEGDLLAAALDRLASLVDKPLLLQSGEFTRKDAEIKLGLKDSMVERELERLVKEGILDRAERQDPRTGRKCWGYWFRA